MKVTFDTRISFNGKEYDSTDAMPAEVRQVYEEAMRRFTGGGIKMVVDSKIIFNGREYSSPDEMPNEVRLLYQQLTGTFDKNGDGIPDVLQGSAVQAQREIAAGFIGAGFTDHMKPREQPPVAGKLMIMAAALLLLWWIGSRLLN